MTPDSPSTGFDILVERALDDLPVWIQEQMQNVVITVAEWPSPEQMRAMRARPAGRAPGMLLGLYEGIPLTRRTRSYHLAAPDRITLFRGPLLRLARSGEDLRRLIRHTVVHEVAHHFGFSEQQLRELDC
jgi:predicted Zn-dependent protease with MMP-like domain